NLFNHLDSISVQYQTTPQEFDELEVLAASYSLRLNGRGDTLTFYHVSSNSDVAATSPNVAGTNFVLGNGKASRLRPTLPVSSSAAGYHSLTMGLDYKDFAESISPDHTDRQNAVETPITYTSLSLGQLSIWRGARMDFTLNSTLNLGLRGIGDHAQQFADK